MVNSGELVNFAPAGDGIIGSMNLAGLTPGGGNTAFKFDATSPANCDLIRIGGAGLNLANSPLINVWFGTVPRPAAPTTWSTASVGRHRQLQLEQQRFAGRFHLGSLGRIARVGDPRQQCRGCLERCQFAQ